MLYKVLEVALEFLSGFVIGIAWFRLHAVREHQKMLTRVDALRKFWWGRYQQCLHEGDYAHDASLRVTTIDEVLKVMEGGE